MKQEARTFIRWAFLALCNVWVARHSQRASRAREACFEALQPKCRPSRFHRLAVGMTTMLALPVYALAGISFGEPRVVTVNARSGLRTLISGDWNGDGRTDLAAVDGQSLWIFEGDGEGGFRAALELAVSNPVQIAAVDLNSDKRSDLLVYQCTNENPTCVPSGEFIAFLSEGDFRFGSPIRFQPSVSSGPAGAPQVLGFVIADLNRDGSPDLLLTLNPPGRDSVLLGHGDGTFANPIPGPATFNLVGVADFNSDGVPDVLIRQANGPYIYYGHGDGTFDSPVGTNLCQPESWCFIQIVDADGDASPDLLLADVGWGWTGNLRVFRGNGHGGFDLAATLPDSLAGDEHHGYTLVFADLNADKVPDLFRMRSWSADDGSGNLAGAYTGVGDEVFVLSSEVLLPYSGLSMLADVNADGLPDIVATDGTNLLVFINTSQQTRGQTYRDAASKERR